MARSADPMQPVAGAALSAVGVLIDLATAEPWQHQCLQVLQQELGPRLRFVRPTAVASSPRGDDIELVVILAGQPPDNALLARLPTQTWHLGFGTAAGLRRSVADLAWDLMAYRSSADVHVIEAGPGGQRPHSRFRTTIRIWPWRPRQSLDRLRRQAPRCLQAALRLALASGLPQSPEAAEPLPPVRPVPAADRWRDLLMTLLAKVYWLYARIWRELFFREHWRIGILSQSAADLVRGTPGQPVQWLEGPGALVSIADPLVAVVGADAWLLAEQLDHRTAKGIIVAAPLAQAATPEAYHPLLEIGAHLSYPGIAEEDGAVWLCPEAWESGKLSRHALAIRDGELETGAAATMLAGWPAVDPTLFRHDGTWWLFCANQEDSPNENLYLWFAGRLEGPWHPHPWNPVVSDIRHARPAGPVTMVDGAMIRPAQDCSATYGGALALMQIERLSRTEYRERLLRRLAPAADGPMPHGLHSFSPHGGRIIVDGKRWLFSPLNPLLKLIAWRQRRLRLRRLRRRP